MRRQKRHASLFLPRDFLVLLSLFYGCSREDKEEHAGSDISLPPESFRIVSVEPEDAAEQVSIQTSLKIVFNS